MKIAINKDRNNFKSELGFFLTFARAGGRLGILLICVAIKKPLEYEQMENKIPCSKKMVLKKGSLQL